MKRQPNENARRALNEMKMEIANELNIPLADSDKTRRNINERSTKMDEKHFYKNEETFNPS